MLLSIKSDDGSFGYEENVVTSVVWIVNESWEIGSF